METTNSAALPLKRKGWEAYARERSVGCGPWQAAKNAGLAPRTGVCTRLERHPDVQARILYLSAATLEVLAEKRRRVEEREWMIHDAPIEAFYEDVEEPVIRSGKLVIGPDGKPLFRTSQRLKRFSELPTELLPVVESLTYTDSGRANLKLYSKADASRELRKMNGLDVPAKQEQTEGKGRSSEEILQELKELAIKLGIMKHLVEG